MRRLALAALAALCLAAGAAAAPQPSDPPPENPGDAARQEYDAAKAEIDKARKEFQDAYKEAKTDEERQKVYADRYPKPETWAPRFQALAEKYPKDPVAAESLTWIVQNVRTAGTQAAALDLILANHLASKAVGGVCQSLQHSNAPNAESFLRAVMLKSADHEAQGRACYTLAKLLSSQGDLAARLKDGDDKFRESVAGWYGKDAIDRLAEADPASLAKQSETLLEEVASKYGDLTSWRGTLADRAKGDLFEIRSLAVGKVAPEIEGEDADGVRFKLSDYRGKVVLLDFWGFW